jgi:hypothetical protein
MTARMIADRFCWRRPAGCAERIGWSPAARLPASGDPLASDGVPLPVAGCAAVASRPAVRAWRGRICSVGLDTGTSAI